MSNNIFEQFNNMFPYIKAVCDNEVSMAVTDTNQYLYVDMCRELDLKLKKGDRIPGGGAVKDALVTGRTSIKEVPEHVYGIPFKSYAIPILENNKVCGVFVLGKSLIKKKRLVL